VKRLCLAALVLAAACTGNGPAETPPKRPGKAPNVLIILTDDQRFDSMGLMPQTRKFFGEAGTRFVNAFATRPQCCPSRASILTGLYPHNHGVLTNEDAAELDETRTLQRYLQNAGYRTTIVGKYLNYLGGYRDPATAGIDPEFFDDWTTFLGGYRNPLFNSNGSLEPERGYATNLIRNRAIDLLHDFEANDARPWMLYVAPFAPHPSAVPAPKYADAPVPAWKPNPAVSERDVSDKPPYVRTAHSRRGLAKRERREQLRTLLSVDDLVGGVTATIDELGESEDTLAIFMSDNGYQWLEHGLRQKGVPYTYSVMVPLYLRWPGHVEGGAVDRRIVGNIDITPTILDAVGISPDAALDGSSLLSSKSRDRILLSEEAIDKIDVPAWASIRARTYQYVEYYSPSGDVTFREYYELKSDPWQLDNLLGDADPANDPDVDALGRQLAADRDCNGASCP
jgi:arylsulfatase A-like enzyme